VHAGHVVSVAKQCFERQSGEAPSKARASEQGCSNGLSPSFSSTLHLYGRGFVLVLTENVAKLVKTHEISQSHPKRRNQPRGLKELSPGLSVKA